MTGFQITVDLLVLLGFVGKKLTGFHSTVDLLVLLGFVGKRLRRFHSTEDLLVLLRSVQKGLKGFQITVDLLVLSGFVGKRLRRFHSTVDLLVLSGFVRKRLTGCHCGPYWCCWVGWNGGMFHNSADPTGTVCITGVEGIPDFPDTAVSRAVTEGKHGCPAPPVVVFFSPGTVGLLWGALQHQLMMESSSVQGNVLKLAV